MGSHGLLGGWHLNSELSIVQNALVERLSLLLRGGGQSWLEEHNSGSEQLPKVLATGR